MNREAETKYREADREPSPSASLYHPLSIGSLALPGNLFLAPVAGYTDRAFRSVCIEAGADFTFTELISSEALVRNPLNMEKPDREWTGTAGLMRRAFNERRYAIQLFGSSPEVMYKAAKLLAPLKCEAVDINCGCPVPKVVKTGAGAALMRDPAAVGRIVEAVVRASGESLGSVPVTVKLRSGWDDSSITYAECARIAVEAGAAMVTLHPRTRAQAYGGKSDWSRIEHLAGCLPIPVAGSGDLYSAEDAERMLRTTGCAAVMFARGAMGNPFIFSAARALLSGLPCDPPGVAERVRTGFRQLLLLAEDCGERTACREMRKQFCAYTKGGPGEKGMAGSAALRNRLVHAETIEEYRSLFYDMGIAIPLTQDAGCRSCMLRGGTVPQERQKNIDTGRYSAIF
ncbi:MAG: tRNA dihydrouridine synthase DusB [Treponema sp.]|jgi:nifR3 family TIM-barrel protein|nr:tRNA dihydrouridine synthase DusB [Treponema sp.]